MNSNIRKGANSSYFGDIIESVKTLSGGLWLTLKHIFQATKRRNNAYVTDSKYFDDKTGLVTLQYPYETLPVPDNGRYRLHNEIDDCIVCDKCAKICPVDCITIESIKSTEEIGKTSDGTSKRLYAPIFDIDLAKCCYCGLCTTVCPTECLTMTKVYDFSEADVDNFIYKFSDMTPTQAEEKRKEAELVAAQKEAAKVAKATPQAVPEQKTEQNQEITTEAKPAPRPAFKPKARPLASSEETAKTASETPEYKPGEEIKSPTSETGVSAETKAAPRPVFRPKMKSSPASTDENSETGPSKVEPVKAEQNSEENTVAEKAPPAKPTFRPKMKLPQPKGETNDEQKNITEGTDNEGTKAESRPEEVKPSARPVFRPKIRPIKPPGESSENQ